MGSPLVFTLLRGRCLPEAISYMMKGLLRRLSAPPRNDGVVLISSTDDTSLDGELNLSEISPTSLLRNQTSCRYTYLHVVMSQNIVQGGLIYCNTMHEKENQMDETDLQQFESHRRLMFSIAYRMLGSAAEAEDILQDAFLRYQTAQHDEINSPKAFLSTIVTRLCLNRLESAQSQRETYIGTWLPEPILTDDRSIDAVQQTELHESLSMAFLVLLEQLTPFERAVFLLRQVFDYGYNEIAEMIGNDETACRQLFSRAKKHISENRPRFKSNPEKQHVMLEQFVVAVSQGKMDGLLQLLSNDVTLWADGGGKVRGAALESLHGREAVARFVIASPNLTNGLLEPRIALVNYEPALLLQVEGETQFVVMLSIDDESIREIRIIANPDKLQGVK